MSYTSLEAFEASLEENRIRRNKPSINKKALKNVLHHVESHNRNQQEQEMWKKHFSSKSAARQDPSSEDERGRKKKRKKREKSEHKRKKKRKLCGVSNPKSDESDTDPIGPLIEEFLKPKPKKWGHDGYHKLYTDKVDSGSPDSEEDIKDDKLTKHKKKKAKRKKSKKDKDSLSDESMSIGKRKKS